MRPLSNHKDEVEQQARLMKMVETIRREFSEKQDIMAEEVSMIKAMVQSLVSS